MRLSLAGSKEGAAVLGNMRFTLKFILLAPRSLSSITAIQHRVVIAIRGRKQPCLAPHTSALPAGRSPDDTRPSPASFAATGSRGDSRVRLRGGLFAFGIFGVVSFIRFALKSILLAALALHAGLSSSSVPRSPGEPNVYPHRSAGQCSPDRGLAHFDAKSSSGTIMRLSGLDDVNRTENRAGGSDKGLDRSKRRGHGKGKPMCSHSQVQVLACRRKRQDSRLT